MIIEIVLSMQFFSKQNNSSVFVLGLAGKKSVSSFFTPIQLCEWTPSRREMREINVEIQTLYGSEEKQGFVKAAISRAVCLQMYESVH